MLPLTPAGLLSAAVAMGADREAVVDDVRRLTYRELADAVDGATAQLASLGVARGDRVAHLGRNSTTHAVLFFATARLHAMYVALDPWLRPSALDVLLRSAAPKALVLGTTFRGRPFAAELKASTWQLPDSLLTVDEAVLSRTDPVIEAASEESDRDAPHLIVFTSGTTGEPRGIVYTQGAFAEQALVMCLALGMAPTDRFLNVYPPGHYGSVIPILQTAAVGACLVQSGVPTPQTILESVVSERISVLIAVPAVWRRLLEQPGATRDTLSTLRRANIGSDSVPPRLIELVMDRTGAVAQQGYGLTETGLVTLVPAADARGRVGSAGLPLPFAAVVIRRPDGAPAAPREEGEVWVKSAYGMAGFWDGIQVVPRTDKTSDGFLPTGDIGWIDEDGYVTISGREEDSLKLSGYRVSASAIEDVLRDHPGCADAAVVGVQTDDGGQVPVAIVVPRAARDLRASELTAWVVRSLQPQAAPVQFLIAESIPRTEGTSKIRRRELLDRVRAREFPQLAG